MQNPDRFPAQDRFADGAQYIDGPTVTKGTFGRTPHGRRPGDRRGRPDPTSWPAPTTSTRRSPRPRPPSRAGPAPRRPNAPTPCSACRRPGAAPGSSPRRVPPDRQADPAGHRVRRPGHHRQHRVLRRCRAESGGQGGGRVRRRPHLERPPRADRRGRLHRAVELPAADGRLEDPPGDRRGKHDRAQARRAHPADLPDVRRGRHGRRHPGRCGQRRHGRGPGPASTWSATRTSSWSPSPAPPPSAGRSWRWPPRRSSASTWSSAARPRSWCSTTPTSRPPRTARLPARSSTAARTAPPRPAPTSAPALRRLRRAVAELMDAVRLGDPTDPATDLGP